MLIYKTIKRPDEKVIAEWSFDSGMASDETIVSQTATSDDFTITAVGVTADGRGVACLVDEGEDGEDPIIKFGVVTSLGQELFDEVILRVRNDPYPES